MIWLRGRSSPPDTELTKSRFAREFMVVPTRRSDFGNCKVEDIGSQRASVDKSAQRFRLGNFESIHDSTNSQNRVACSAISLASVSVATCDRV